MGYEPFAFVLLFIGFGWCVVSHNLVTIFEICPPNVLRLLVSSSFDLCQVFCFSLTPEFECHRGAQMIIEISL